MTALKTLLEQTGCAEELAVQPGNWVQLMTAVAAGAIDYDSVAEVALECVALANRAGGDWDAKVIEALHASDGDISSEASQTLVACGMAADQWVQRGAN